MKRRRLWFLDGLGLTLGVLAGVVGAAAGEYGAGFWHAVGALMIVLAAASAVLAGLELIAAGQLVPLGWWMLLTAVPEAATLLAANWKEHVSELYAHVLISATILLLSGLVVGTLRLIVRGTTATAVAAFWSVAGLAVAIDVLGFLLTWSRGIPGEVLSALMSLISFTILLYVLTPLLQRFSRPPSPG